jgi:hypothetical protein
MMTAYDVAFCEECKTLIPTEEYVVNWGSCNKCFDKGYEEYLSQRKINNDSNSRPE